MLDKALIPFFQENMTFWPHLTEDEKNLLLDHSMLKNYAQSENIHSGDNDCVGVLLIQSGELRTYILSEDGRDITLYRLKISMPKIFPINQPLTAFPMSCGPCSKSFL
ncbi:MAG: family transcriptional regulator, anaerobic regulatory protein [Eubacteriaceae bacterium]|nr:family transcriptional regulator, anaerobic regulatory protein [Eubacteriaceae bacterium]